MIQKIRVRKDKRWMIWSTWNWSRILIYTALACLVIYVGYLLKMNMVMSQVKSIEQKTVALQRDSTRLQSEIYSRTRNVSFMQLSTAHAMALVEPTDGNILYMQLPAESKLVMR